MNQRLVHLRNKCVIVETLPSPLTLLDVLSYPTIMNLRLLFFFLCLAVLLTLAEVRIYCTIYMCSRCKCWFFLSFFLHVLSFNAVLLLNQLKPKKHKKHHDRNHGPHEHRGRHGHHKHDRPRKPSKIKFDEIIQGKVRHISSTSFFLWNVWKDMAAHLPLQTSSLRSLKGLVRMTTTKSREIQIG